MTVDETLAIQINGEQRHVPAGVTIDAMLHALGVDPTRVAVERNFEIVPRSTFGKTPVVDGDAFEIVHFVGGG